MSDLGVLKIGCPYWKIYNPTDIMMHFDVNLSLDFCKVSTTFFSQIHYENTLNEIMQSLFSSILNFLFHGKNYDFCLHLFITFVRRTFMQAMHNVRFFVNFCPVFGEFLTWSFQQSLQCAVKREMS